MSVISNEVSSTDIGEILLASVVSLITGAVLLIAYPVDAVDYFPDTGLTTGLILLSTAVLFFLSGFERVRLVPLLILVSVIQIVVLTIEYATATFIAASPLMTSVSFTAVICAILCVPSFFLGRRVSYIPK